MNTEITDTKVKHGWVLYDRECRICTAAVRRWAPALARRGFVCLPLQTDWVRERLHLSEDELMREMRVLTAADNVVGGGAALVLLARHFWWGLPLVWAAKLPCVFRLLDAAYRWGAARRYCANNTCRLPTRRFNWPALLLPVAVPLLARDLAPWLFMWIMAAALWFALKLFTLLNVPHRALGRSMAFLFAWPGMDAPEFLSAPTTVRLRLPSAGWAMAIINVAIGTVLVFAGARAAYAFSGLLAGWLAMIGIVLVLHFGLFKLAALLWRALGIPATPIMDAPLRSRSLSEFWGRRWNTGFSIPARRYVMEPVARRYGTVTGLSTVFLVSGLVHELVISLPARAGYGLPTLYFLIQAAGLIWERKAAPNRLRTIAWITLPAAALFHPPFVHHVIIPFLEAIGAL